MRAEYPVAVQRLAIAIKQAKEYGLLGKNVSRQRLRLRSGSKTRRRCVRMRRRDSALMTSIEGHSGEPRPKTASFPAVKGLFGNSLLVLNNVETYANIPQIILNGADWFANIGTEKSKGTKVFALGGKINNIRSRGSPYGYYPQRDHLRYRRRHSERQEVQGCSDRRPSQADVSRLNIWTHLSTTTHLTDTRFDDGLRRSYRNGRRHLHGRSGQVLPGIHGR